MRRRLIGTLAVALMLGWWANPARAADDPWQSFNQMMFDFNNRYYASAGSGVSQFLVDHVPAGVRHGVANVFANLGEPMVVLTSVAAGEYDNARIAARRFAINTVYGVGGIYDPAGTDYGLRSRPKSVPQVLCSYGVPAGPYLVVPFYGPATVSDFVGAVAPVVAGYVTFGELFWAYRASSQVAVYLEPPVAGPGPGAEPIPVATAEADYEALREHYLHQRTRQCPPRPAPPEADHAQAAAPVD